MARHRERRRSAPQRSTVNPSTRAPNRCPAAVFGCPSAVGQQIVDGSHPSSDQGLHSVHYRRDVALAPNKLDGMD